MKKLLFVSLFLFASSVYGAVIDFEELSYRQSVAYDLYEDQGIILDSSTEWKIYNSPGRRKTLLNKTRFGGDLAASFTRMMSSVKIVLGDWVRDKDKALLEAYDSNGELLASDFGKNKRGFFSLSVSAMNIASFRVFTKGAVVYDKIAFKHQAYMAPAPVAEPPVLALILLGVLGLAATRRRQLLGS